MAILRRLASFLFFLYIFFAERERLLLRVVVVVVLTGNRSQTVATGPREVLFQPLRTVVTGKIKRLVPNQTPANGCKRSTVCKQSIY
jgi:hypothetical protein